MWKKLIILSTYGPTSIFRSGDVLGPLSESLPRDLKF